MKELLANLQKLGLSQYEAKAYLALLRRPRVTAYEIAKLSRVPPSKIYEVVEKLLGKDLISTTEVSGSTRYLPIPPREAMARYRRNYDEVLDYLDDQLTQINKEERLGSAYVSSLIDRDDILGKAVEMIASSTQEVYLAVWPEELPALDSALRDADERGVAIVICHYGPEDPGVGVVYNHDVDPKVLSDQGERRLVLVVDHRETLVAYFPEVGEATGHWSSNVGFVQMTGDYIRHDIWVIKLVRRFADEVAAIYGPNRERLRDVLHAEAPEVSVLREKRATVRAG